MTNQWIQIDFPEVVKLLGFKFHGTNARPHRTPAEIFVSVDQGKGFIEIGEFDMGDDIVREFAFDREYKDIQTIRFFFARSRCQKLPHCTRLDSGLLQADEITLY